jgi:hypothetical protein
LALRGTRAEWGVVRLFWGGFRASASKPGQGPQPRRRPGRRRWRRSEAIEREAGRGRAERSAMPTAVPAKPSDRLKRQRDEAHDEQLPEGIPRLQERLGFMQAPIDTLRRFLHQVEDFGGAEPSPNAAAAARGPTLLTKLFTGTRYFASGFFTTVLFLFFLLVSGDIFLHRLVEILPRFSGKRQVVDISQQIESDISAYLVTIMNAAVGIGTALAMRLTGAGDLMPMSGWYSRRRFIGARMDVALRYPRFGDRLGWRSVIIPIFS